MSIQPRSMSIRSGSMSIQPHSMSTQRRSMSIRSIKTAISIFRDETYSGKIKKSRISATLSLQPCYSAKRQRQRNHERWVHFHFFQQYETCGQHEQRVTDAEAFKRFLRKLDGHEA